MCLRVADFFQKQARSRGHVIPKKLKRGPTGYGYDAPGACPRACIVPDYPACRQWAPRPARPPGSFTRIPPTRTPSRSARHREPAAAGRTIDVHPHVDPSCGESVESFPRVPVTMLPKIPSMSDATVSSWAWPARTLCCEGMLDSSDKVESVDATTAKEVVERTRSKAEAVHA